MSKDALRKFRPSSGVPNFKQKFKRVGYLAGGGDVTSPMDASSTMDASDTIDGRPYGMVTPTSLPAGNGMKRGGAVRGCGIAIKGKTKGRTV
jgi:hypothetical protein